MLRFANASLPKRRRGTAGTLIGWQGSVQPGTASRPTPQTVALKGADTVLIHFASLLLTGLKN